MKTLLWLDDIRDPKSELWNNFIAKNIGNPLKMDIVWVKNYDEFRSHIYKHGLPDIISFDHDLGDIYYQESGTINMSKSKFFEKTGYHCAKWLVEHCIESDLQLPKWYVHSSNIVGARNISSYLINYEKRK